MEHKLLKFITVALHLWLTVMMLLPTSDIPDIDIPHIDKLVHLGAYTLLFLLWAFSFIAGSSRFSRAVLWLIFGLTFYGMVIEVIQGKWIPDRTFDLWDMAANCLGILLGWMLFYILRGRIIHKS